MTNTPRPPQAGDRLVASSAPPRPHRPAMPGGRIATPWQRAVSAVAYLVKVASRVAALSVLLYALFTVFEANPANIWYRFVESLASWASLGLAGLFQLDDPRHTALVNYGLAAVVWLITGSALAGLIRRAAP
ncbi:hypothetical protein E1267_07405 [Nonomuraea longispora]|uniref:Uncharacterized protein n=1 Tax=Nonomuraea longispora TaxID=1848320 RepID=A0A4R4NQQ0_9ACTN|nr:hypothetical protein [Nonomuraea longispora]TDC09472.1 hypothetical protein E1267_07405 [Nonomuraea longispora]